MSQAHMQDTTGHLEDQEISWRWRQGQSLEAIRKARPIGLGLSFTQKCCRVNSDLLGGGI